MNVLHRAARFARVAAVVGSLALLAGCQTASEVPSQSQPVATTTPSATPSSSPAATASAGPRETSVFDLAVGDCFSTDTDELISVGVVDCAETHHYEVFALLDHDAGDDEAFPGDGALLAFAETACQAPFEEFVGHDYQTSIWYISALHPSVETWAEGDREIVCVLHQRDEAGDPVAVTGSAAGAAE
jgi:Septum formation